MLQRYNKYLTYANFNRTIFIFSSGIHHYRRNFSRVPYNIYAYVFPAIVLYACSSTTPITPLIIWDEKEMKPER